MPVDLAGQKLPADLAGCAVTVARIVIGEQDDSAFEQGGRRRGGQSGGRARAENLAALAHSESARQAAEAGWATKRGRQ